MQNVFVQLTNLLKKDERLVSQDGLLLKNQVQELARKNDPQLIKLILSDTTIKKHFFFEVEKTLIFDKEKFIRFVSNKQFLPDSYTAFKNKIGLTADEEYLSENKEVVLVWPYKDCVLEGGMTKEDQKRDEIFYNETLAPDDINRLLDPKVFTNFKRIDKDGEHKLDGFERNEKGTIKDNLIIKGNNLLALASLKKEFAGKVKLIYIDPPYNTGSDSFGYNDSFNHSSWLTFMKNRLDTAKQLLSKEGVIFVQCDSREQAYLKVLMDEIFGRENFIEVITVVNNPRGRDYGGVANMHEFINVYAKSGEYELYRLEEKDKEFPYKDSLGGFEIRELRNRNIAFNDKNRPNLVYPFFVNPKVEDDNGFYEIDIKEKPGWVKVMPAKSQGVQTVWRWGKEKAIKEMNINIRGKQMQNEGWQIVEKYREKSTMARSVWWDKLVNSERGTLHIKELFNGKVFDHPKPEETLWRIIEMATREGDVVMDFFAGTGTTGSVALKTKRQFVLCEQMDYVEKLTNKRLEKTIEGEQGGVSKTVGWNGGGDFVYMELAKWNEAWIEKIEKAKAGTELAKLWDEMKENAFLSYKVDLKTIDANAKEVADLSIDDQKRFLIECLDKNQLYINYSEIEDRDYGVVKEDKNLNENFYI